MLEALAAEIKAGGTLEIRNLAEKLGTTPEMVEAMLEHLQRSGLIRPWENCDEACAGCGLQKTCKAARQEGGVRLWQG